MDNDAIKIEALKEALSDPKLNAAVSRAFIELGALCERMAEGFQRFAREVEKMAEDADAAEPEAAEVGRNGVVTSEPGVHGGIAVDIGDGDPFWYPPEALDPIDG